MSETITVLHRRDVIRGVRDRWLRQYQSYADGSVLGWGDKRTTAGEVRHRLGELDLETATPEDVDGAIQTTGWANLRCDSCGENFETLVRIGEEPDYEARWQDLCAGCLQEAINLLTD